MVQRHKTEVEIRLIEHDALKRLEWRGRKEWLIDLRVDLEAVLGSDVLTPRDRQVSAMYLCGLDQEEMAQLWNISQQALSKHVHMFLKRLLSAMMGTGTAQSQDTSKHRLTLVDPAWDAWMVNVLHNNGKWWNVPNSVRRFIQKRFGCVGLYPSLTDYDEDDEAEEYPIRFEQNWLGRSRTFTGQRNEVEFIDEINNDDKSNEDIADVKVTPNAWPKYPYDGLIRKEPGFWSATV